jgi:putative nucleotidyltransferase with HDIG domain
MVPVLSFRKRGMFVWRHTLGTIDALDALIRSASRRERERGYFLREISSGRSYAALLKLAAMLHDISKPVTYRYADGKVSFYGHERRGARESAEICQRLKLSNDEVKARQVGGLSAFAPRVHGYRQRSHETRGIPFSCATRATIQAGY